MDQIVKTADASKTADRLITILEQDLGLTLARGGGAERGAYTLWEIVEAIRQSSIVSGNDIQNKLRVGAGMHDLAKKICAVWDHHADQRDSLVPHLRMLAGADFIFQNEANDRWTKTQPGKAKEHGDADKVIELYWACLCICAGFKKVTLDDPVRSSGGKNPDVLATASDGRLWGFSAKTLAISASLENVAKNLCEHIQKGVKQVEAANADAGAVVVNLKNVIDHSQIWSREPYETWQEAHFALKRKTEDIRAEFEKHCASDDLAKLFKDSPVAPVIVMVAHTSVGVYPPNAVYPSISEINGLFVKSVFQSQTVRDIGSRAAEVWTVCDHLNHQMQTLK